MTIYLQAHLIPVSHAEAMQMHQHLLSSSPVCMPKAKIQNFVMSQKFLRYNHKANL